MKKLVYLFLMFACTNVTAQTLDLISNINSTNPGDAQNYTKFNNKLYFIAYDAINGGQLWETDGTAANTKIAFVLLPTGFVAGFTPKLTVLKNKLFISYEGIGSANGNLYATDGTLANTVTLGNYDVSNLVLYDNDIYFLSEEASITGYEFNLNKTDGTLAGTTMVQNLENNGMSTLYNSEILVWNNKLIFSGTEASSGELKLVSYDAPTNLFEIISESNFDIIEMHRIKAVGSILYMSAIYKGSTLGVELFSIDNTGTIQLIYNVDASVNGNGSPRDLFMFNKKLFFTARDGVTNGANCRQLYVVDTPSVGLISYAGYTGTSLNLDNHPRNFIRYKDAMFFTSLTDSSLNLYKLDSATNIGTLVKPICKDGSQQNWYAKYSFVYQGVLYFFCSENKVSGLFPENFQLFQSDGTPEGTKKVLYTNASLIEHFGDYTSEIIEYNNSIYFTGVKSYAPFLTEVYKFNAFPLAIKHVTENDNFIVSPNPFSNSFTIENKNNAGASCALINQSGQIVAKQNITNGNNQIAVLNLPNGMYFLQILNAQQNNIANYKIIKH